MSQVLENYEPTPQITQTGSVRQRFLRVRLEWFGSDVEARKRPAIHLDIFCSEAKISCLTSPNEATPIGRANRAN
jgi:hypothetical protein